MTLTYKGVDLSSYIVKYSYTETPRVIEGPNSGVAINGSGIKDVRAVKYDPSFSLQPLDTTKMAQLKAFLNAQTLGAYGTLVYTDMTGNDVTKQAMLIASGAKLAMDTSDRKVYNEITILFEEQ